MMGWYKTPGSFGCRVVLQTRFTPYLRTNVGVEVRRLNEAKIRAILISLLMQIATISTQLCIHGSRRLEVSDAISLICWSIRRTRNRLPYPLQLIAYLLYSTATWVAMLSNTRHSAIQTRTIQGNRADGTISHLASCILHTASCISLHLTSHSSHLTARSRSTYLFLVLNKHAERSCSVLEFLRSIAPHIKSLTMYASNIIDGTSERPHLYQCSVER